MASLTKVLKFILNFMKLQKNALPITEIWMQEQWVTWMNAIAVLSTSGVSQCKSYDIKIATLKTLSRSLLSIVSKISF